MDKKYYVSWEDVMDFLDVVESWASAHDLNFTGVYGIPRGGVILAVLISHRLHIPFLGAPHDGCLVIDDIADSGRTLLHFTNNDTQRNKYYITTMFYDQRSSVLPDCYAHRKHDRWIVFPWEVD